MRVFDLIDVRFAQFRAFKAVLMEGLYELGIEVGACEPEEVAEASESDIVLVPPYGVGIDAARRNLLRTKAQVLMVDLKGPMGIDSFLMLQDRLGPHAHYATTMACDPAFKEPLGALISRGVTIGALPFFPHPLLIERANILARYKLIPIQRDPELVLYFAGAVWGERARLLAAAEAAGLPVKIEHGLDPIAYLKALTGASLCLDLAGGQSQTYRFHEIMLTGSCCLCEKRLLHHPGRAPLPGVEVMFFEGFEDLFTKASELLRDVDLRTRIANRGALWYREIHAPRAYATHVISLVMQTHRDSEC